MIHQWDNKILTWWPCIEACQLISPTYSQRASNKHLNTSILRGNQGFTAIEKSLQQKKKETNIKNKQAVVLAKTEQ